MTATQEQPKSGKSSRNDGGYVPKLDQPAHMVPQNIEAEEAILGSMLRSTFGVEVAEQMGLKAEHFYRPSHRTLFNVIMELAVAGTVDELTVVNQLKQQRVLGEVGGAANVMSLSERCPAVANSRAYAQEVLDQAVLRRLVETGNAISVLGYEHPDTPEALVSQAGELVATVDAPGAEREFVPMDDLLDGLYAEWMKRADEGGGIVGNRTGLTQLDAKLGGLQPGKVYVIAGRPGMGKSAFAMNIAEHVAIIEQQHVAVFNFEMDPADLTARMVSSIAKVNGHRLTNTAPKEDDWEHIVAAMRRIQTKAPGRLLLSPSSQLTPFQIRTRTRRLKRRLEREGGELGLVVLDYLQLMHLGKRSDNREQEVSAMSREVKAMAMELQVPVLLLSQLNRGVEMRADKRPMLSDLRESGSVEQDADVVMLLFRPEYYFGDETPSDKLGKAEVIVAKHRRGKPGSVWLAFIDKYTRFATLSH
jgi:replicative DNA helicase